MIPRGFPRLFLPCALFMLGAVCGRSEDLSATAKEAPLALPAYTVTDSRELPPVESWHYGEIPGFEILSNASERETKRLIKDFGMFRQAVNLVWPIPNRGAYPTSLILCGKGGKFDTFLPPGKSVGNMARVSLFFQDPQHSAIVIDLQATVLNVSGSDSTDDAATGTDSSQISVDHNKQLYREYVHYLLNKSDLRLPAWFQEGMAQIIMRIQFDPKQIVVGRLEEPNTISYQASVALEQNAAALAEDPEAATMMPGAPAEDRDFNVALRRKRLIPLGDLFAIGHDAPEALNPLGNNRWAKQCYAFVHLCLYGEGKKYQKPLQTFLVRLQKEPVSEQLFKECFNMPYSKMITQIRNYCETAVYQSQEFNAKKGSLLLEATDLSLRAATPSEVGRIKGETLALAGMNEKARAELIAPYIRNERDPRLLAALGLFDHANGDDERARKLLDGAVAGKVVRPEAYLELARLRYADAVKIAGETGPLTDAQVASVTSLLDVAVKQRPPMVGVYELLADVWSRSPTKIKRDDAVVLIQGSMAFPTRLKLIYQTAILSADAGAVDAAHTLVDHGRKYAMDSKTKARFEELKTSLPPLPPAAPK